MICRLLALLIGRESAFPDAALASVEEQVEEVSLTSLERIAERYGPVASERIARLERDVEVLELLNSARFLLGLSTAEREIVCEAVADQAVLVERSLAAVEEFAA